ncbi:cupin domain-containing protein [Haladaptatus salinisoli]|uniref:cupin domain-containing protein n=1 Tax=Haladaptatus salinisoli TaxID=2884876 RepID=UPI001D0B027F|nr:cupin domain-containing protein [Haladaptatus salinisoli]
MKKVAVNDREPVVLEENLQRRGLSEPLETSNLALNHYRIGPGEGFPGGIHTHMDQEEVFIVIEGEAVFETLDGKVTISEGEAIRFAPGEFQSGKNESNTGLVVLAIGAPRNSEDMRIPVECPECNHDNVRLDFNDEDGLRFVCPRCGTKQTPQNCPECGDDDLRITLGDQTQTIVVCQGCGTEFETPPLRE